MMRRLPELGNTESQRRAIHVRSSVELDDGTVESTPAFIRDFRCSEWTESREYFL